MRYIVLAILSMGLFMGSSFAENAPELKDDQAKVSYSIGYQVGGDFKRQGMNINADILLQGMKDALAGNSPLLSDDEMKAELMKLQEKVTAAQEKEMREESEKNKSEGQAFLMANKNREGIITLPSGLQYKVISEGSGRKPASTDTVSVHYKGTLVDGTEFDSSYKRGKPAIFKADRVIKGWQEALIMMKEGAKWQLFIPAELAYGQRRTGRIGPNSTLIFDVELLEVKSVKD